VVSFKPQLIEIEQVEVQVVGEEVWEFRLFLCMTILPIGLTDSELASNNTVNM
jgi:hypothetical protein